MSPADPLLLLLVAAAGVALVVILVTWARMPAFVALTLASLCVGVAARMPLLEIPRAFQAGVGDTLGFVAMVIALGTVIGKLLAESGGAVVVSNALVGALGERRVGWALMLSGFIIGLPVFFQVGLVLLAPVLFTVTRRTGTPLLAVGLPLVAALSTVHGLVPPHPGPLAAIERLGADPGRTLFYSLIIGFPVAVLAGPLFGGLMSRYVRAEPGAMADQLAGTTVSTNPPSLIVTIVTMLMPVLLMLGAALAQGVMADTRVRHILVFTGTPLMAMLLATLVAMITFGRACGFDRVRLLQFAEESLTPIASVLLVVGAGGGFGRVLDLCRRRYRDRSGDERAAAVAARAWMGDRVPAAGGRRIGNGGCRDRRQHHGSHCCCRAEREPRAAGGLDRRRLPHRFPRQRRGLLAGEGVSQHDRPPDLRDVDGHRDDRIDRRTRRSIGAERNHRMNAPSDAL